MTLRWEDFPEELNEIGGYIFEACANRNIRFGEASEIFKEFIQRPRRHLPFEDDWIEFIKGNDIRKVLLDQLATSEEKRIKLQEENKMLKEFVKSLEVQIKLEDDTREDSEADKVVETIETPKVGEEAHDEEEDKEEDQEKLFPNYDSQLQKFLDEFMKTNRASLEKQLVEIETDQRDASSVLDEDFYKGAEPQPMKFQEQDLQQKEQPSNKAEEKAEIDKVIDMICALFATINLKRVWKQYPLFLKFLGFLTKKRKKTDDIFHLSYKTP
ncbi:hypothetical protein QL285_057885 [Trifolium repens]|nr:hypothetical protein QL285_057885 [Trifolium repens]